MKQPWISPYTPYRAVIPAKAGVSPVRNEVDGEIPAFAGMTNERLNF